MARRKKNDQAAVLLLALPWQASAVLGGLAFVALRWLFPLVMKGNMFLPIMMPLARLASWLAVFLFAILTLGSYIRSRKSFAPKRILELADFASPAQPRIEPRIIAPESKPRIIPEQTPKPTAAVESLPRPKAWSLEALRFLEWKRFELLCAKYYEMTGFKAETMQCGPDGGIDVKLFKMGYAKPAAIVQCKAWNAYDVGVKEIRELLGVMTHEKVGQGIFATTGSYTKDAIAFAEANPIEIIDGEAFIVKIGELMEVQRMVLLDFAFEGDFWTPTCPSCGLKMLRRQGKRGEFFGCSQYPTCRRTLAT